MIKQKLIDKFGGVINHMSCIYLNDGENVLRSYLKDIGEIDTVIEIGTYQGVSSCIICEYAKNVHTIDIEERELTDKIISFLGVNNITKHIVTGRQDEFELVDSILSRNKIDLVFIDGEHFNGELEKDFDMVKTCKNILIHDYTASFSEVYDFCNQKEDEGWIKDVRGTFCLLSNTGNIQDKKPAKKRKKRVSKNASNK